MQFENIPQELKDLNQWFLWRIEKVKGDIKKVPYQINGEKGGYTDPQKGASFDKVLALFDDREGFFDGIGFAFTEQDPYVGIDLDKVIDEKGEISEEALEVLNSINSYTEYSPSKRGFHIIAKGKLPEEGSRRGFLEMYDKLRYFTMTGNVYRPIEIKEQQEGINHIHDKYIKKQTKEETAPINSPPVTYAELPDDKLLEIAKKERGGKFNDLWNGNLLGYDSQSEADQALCNKLAFYTGKNAEQMDRLFRQSVLFREKWDEVHKPPDTTYGQMTIKKAINDCRIAYSNPQVVIDFPDWLKNKNGEKRFLFTSENTRALMEHLGFFLRWDVIKRKIKIQQRGAEVLNQNEINIDNLSMYLMDQLRKQGINPKSGEMVGQLNLIAHRNSFNYVKDFLKENGKRNIETDAVNEYLSCFHFEENEEFSRVLLRKWFSQTIAMVFNESGTYGAEGVLTFVGGQGIGKTRSLAMPFLSVVPETYYKKEATFDTTKDSYIQLTSFWVVEFSEMIRSFKEVESLKAFITSPNDIIRLPYGRMANDYPRLTSYCGSTNDETFLKDIHNRRFWTVKISRIDLDRLQKVNYFDFWAELYMDYTIFEQTSFRLTAEERSKLEEVNKNHRIRSEEETIIREKLNWSADKTQWKYKTSTQIAEELSTSTIKLNVRRVGQALTAIGYDKSNRKYHKRLLDGIHRYRVPPYLMPGIDEESTGVSGYEGG